MVQAIERYLKQAIVDKSPAIASSVLASAYHLMQVCPDVVRRWSNEIQEAISGPRIMVQYHALGLLYMIRQNDRLAILKLIQKSLQSPPRSSYAHCIMVCSSLFLFHSCLPRSVLWLGKLRKRALRKLGFVGMLLCKMIRNIQF